MSDPGDVTIDPSAKLTAPGAMFEQGRAVDAHGEIRIWKNGPQTLVDVYRATLTKRDETFLVHGQRRLRYLEFHQAVDRSARFLRQNGICAGDVVAIGASTSIEWLVVFFGIVMTGGVPALLDPKATNAELQHALAISDPRLVVSDRTRLESMREAASRAGLPAVVTSIEDAAFPDAYANSPDPSGADQESDSIASVGAAAATADPGAPGAIFFSAGTTGTPKGVVLSHRSCTYSVFHAAYRNARYSARHPNEAAKIAVSPTDQQCLLLALPLHHTSGLCNGVLPLMVRGGRVVLLSMWSPKLAVGQIESERAAILACVPSSAQQFVRYLEGLSEVPPSLRQIVYGGGPPAADLPGRIDGLGLVAGQNWGMTETGGGVIGHIGLDYLQHPTSCGQAAPVHEAKIVSEAGERAGIDQVGELLIRGPQVMLGYVGDELATKNALSDGWLRTGDLAFEDSDGRIHIVDRLKDMIISSGENIYAREIEDILLACDGVEEAAVFGEPHREVGERVVACVCLNIDWPLSEDDLRVHASRHLARHKVPARIVTRTEPLPRNSMGKIQKQLLKKEWIERRGQQTV